VEMAKIQFTHPTRPIDTMLSTLLTLEIDKLQYAGADFQKMIMIVVISAMPAYGANLKASIESTVTSLRYMSQWTSDQIGVQFIQVGIDRNLRSYLKDLDDDPNTGELVDFTPSGVMSKERIWKMILGSVDSSFDDLDNSKLSTMVVPGGVNPPGVMVNPSKITHSASSLIGPISGYSIPLTLLVGSGFTFTAWFFKTPNTTSLGVFTGSTGFHVLADGRVTTDYRYGGSPYLFTLPNFTWSFISMVWDPTKSPTFYISHNTGIMHKIDGPSTLAQSSSLNLNGFNGGKLENLKVYNSVLTDVQIKSDYIDVPKP